MVVRTVKRFLKRPQMQKYGSYLVRKLASAFSLDLLTLAYKSVGIMNSRDNYESGEHYLHTIWLKRFLSEHAIEQPCFFDVGANVGFYSEQLIANYPNAQIYSFEPQANEFNNLYALSCRNRNIHPFNIALGANTGTTLLYNRQSNQSSIHATMYKDVLLEAWGYDDVQGLSVPVDTLDHFCLQMGIEQIHFLKIDTEGNEFQILQGAVNMLERAAINSIQFEFNKMNVFSRVFLRDFFEILSRFNIYRLLPTALMPVTYQSKHEIFLFQNFLAVDKMLDPLKR